MDKEATLHSVTALASQGMLSETELRDAFLRGSGVRMPEKHRIGVSDVLYYLGGGIVLVGIAIFVGQKWDVMNDVAHVLITLGAGVVAYITGVLLGSYKQLSGPSSAFHFLGAMLIPSGVHVLFIDVFHWEPTLSGSATVFFGLFLLYLVSYAVFERRNIFLLFSILFGTAVYILFTDWLAVGTTLGSDYAFSRIIGAGLTYLFLGYAFRVLPVARGIIAFLNFFGIIMFLGGSLALGGWKPSELPNIIFEVIYPGLALGVIFLSAFLKSRAYLIFGALFLMGYIAKITGEYFADSVGWPLALIVIGFAFMGIGYGAILLNKKYLKT